MRLLGKPMTNQTAWAIIKYIIPVEPWSFSQVYGISKNDGPTTINASASPMMMLAKKAIMNSWNVHFRGGSASQGFLLETHASVTFTDDCSSFAVVCPLFWATLIESETSESIVCFLMQGVEMVFVMTESVCEDETHVLTDGRNWGLFDDLGTFGAPEDFRNEFYDTKPENRR